MPHTEREEELFIPRPEGKRRTIPEIRKPSGSILNQLGLILRALASGAAEEFIPREITQLPQAQASPFMEQGTRLAPLLSGQRVTPASLAPKPILSDLERGVLNLPFQVVSPQVRQAQIAKELGSVSLQTGMTLALAKALAFKALSPVLRLSIGSGLSEMMRPLKPEAQKDFVTAVNDMLTRGMVTALETGALGRGIEALPKIIKAITPHLAGRLAPFGQSVKEEDVMRVVQSKIPQVEQALQKAKIQGQVQPEFNISQGYRNVFPNIPESKNLQMAVYDSIQSYGLDDIGKQVVKLNQEAIANLGVISQRAKDLKIVRVARAIFRALSDRIEKGYKTSVIERAMSSEEFKSISSKEADLARKYGNEVLKSVKSIEQGQVPQRPIISEVQPSSKIRVEFGTRFNHPSEIIEEISNPKYGKQGLTLNPVEMKQLIDYLKTSTDVGRKNRGIIYEPYSGGRDVILGQVKTRFGEETLVAELNKKGEFTGHLRSHSTPIEKREIRGSMAQLKALPSEVQPQPVQITPQFSPEAGIAILGKPAETIRTKDIKASSEQLEKALGETLKEKSPFGKLFSNLLAHINELKNDILNGTKQAFDEYFVYESTVKRWPRLVNGLRKLVDSFFRSQYIALEQIKNILRPLRTLDEFKVFQRIIALEDWLEDKARGLTITDNLSTEEVKSYLEQLRKIAPKTVFEAIDKYKQLMKEIGEELVRRGKLDPEDLRGIYYPHRVIEYIDGIASKTPWFPQRLKEAFRSYTKPRLGSAKEIDMDFMKVINDYLTKVNMHNEIDDFAINFAKELDVTNEVLKLPVEQAQAVLGTIRIKQPDGAIIEKLAPISPGGKYTYKGETYEGWQITPGRQIYPATTHDQQKWNSILYDAMEPGEKLRLLEESAKKGAVLGKYKKVYLIPEAIATRFNNFRIPDYGTSFEKYLRETTSLWRRVAVFSTGVAFQTVNFLSHFPEMYRRDVKSFLKIPKAIGILMKNPAQLDEGAKYLLDLARQESAFGRSTSFMSGGIEPLLRDPETRRFISRGEFFKSAFNPFNIYYTIAQFGDDVPKFAAFMREVEKMHAGKEVKSIIIDISGLSKVEAVGKIVREEMIDMAKVTPAFKKQISGLMFPFATWFVQNAPNWWKYALKNPAGMFGKFGLPWLLLQAWNNTGDRAKTEANLPEYWQSRDHLNTSFTNPMTGKKMILAWESPMSLAFRPLALNLLPNKIRLVLEGKMTAKDAALQQLRDMARETGRIPYELLNPLVKVTLELASNKNFFEIPIVPEKLLESKRPQDQAEVKRIQILHALEGLITPYFQFNLAQKSTEPGSPFSKMASRWMGFGGEGEMRAIGLRGVDLGASRRARRRQEVENQIGRREHDLMRLERSYLTMLRTGTRIPFLRESMRLAREGSFIIKYDKKKKSFQYSRDWLLRQNSPRLRILNLKWLLSQSTDNEERARIRKTIRQLQQVQDAQSMRPVPRSVKEELKRQEIP